MNNRKWVAGCAMLWVVPGFAATGPEILQKTDHAMNAFKDGTFESKLLVKQPSGESREYNFITYQKSPDKRMVRFVSPGDVKGMGVLLEDKETMYVYLPGFQKVRRMGTHVKNQSFMGSDISFEDMSTLNFSDSYEAKLSSEDTIGFQLDLTARAGKDPEFPHLKMWIDKTSFHPSKIESYDAAGKKLKTQTRLDYKKVDAEHFTPGRIIYVDHRRNDHSSEIIFSSSKFDSGLSDELFSVRSLMRGQ